MATLKGKIHSTDFISFCREVRGFGRGADAVGEKYFGFIQVFDICLT